MFSFTHHAKFKGIKVVRFYFVNSLYVKVGEMREKKYEAQNRGVYMFRIDEERLVDATMAGGPARYINHSCDPNCSTRIVASGPNGDDKKIIIIANRPISAGEEVESVCKL